VTKHPCLESYDLGIRRLAGSLEQDILVHSDRGPRFSGPDGEVIAHRAEPYRRGRRSFRPTVARTS